MIIKVDSASYSFGLAKDFEGHFGRVIFLYFAAFYLKSVFVSKYLKNGPLETRKNYLETVHIGY